MNLFYMKVFNNIYSKLAMVGEKKMIWKYQLVCNDQKILCMANIYFNQYIFILLIETVIILRYSNIKVLVINKYVN